MGERGNYTDAVLNGYRPPDAYVVIRCNRCGFEIDVYGVLKCAWCALCNGVMHIVREDVGVDVPINAAQVERYAQANRDGALIRRWPSHEGSDSVSARIVNDQTMQERSVSTGQFQKKRAAS